MRAWLLVFCLVLACAEKNYTVAVLNISTAIRNTSGPFYHKAYDRLANFSDTFGPRLWGSESLELAINDLKRQADEEGFDNVRLEPVRNFSKWIRGMESLTLRSPRVNPWPLKIIGLGWSVSCNVSADVIVVSTFEELDSVKNKVQGKIVVYDEPWTTYGQTVAYRSRGASMAAKYGAVGVLVRSVTPDSIQSVHAGVMHYTSDSDRRICGGAISTEDADMFRRMQKRGQKISVDLVIQSQTGVGNSNNLIFEIVGSQFPAQILLLGGHIDSWDTGSQTGANDDGGGVMTVFEALRLLKRNGFIPRRTLRFIAWSGEEYGGVDNGAHCYAKSHQNELNDHIVAFENDLGSTTLLGFGIEGSTQGLQLLQNITHDYLSPLINVAIANTSGEAVDTGPLLQKGIPTMANIVNDTVDHRQYFTYHHTAGDSMSIMDPDMMDSNVLGIAALFYILADLDVTIERNAS